MFRRNCVHWLLIVWLILPSVRNFPNTFYISPSGDNTDAGSFSEPWATPGYASKQLSAGDSLIILDGTYVLTQYYTDMVTPATGAAGQWIVITGEPGQRPVLAGENNLFSAIQLQNVHYLKIENLEITSYNGALFRDAINNSDSCSNIILSDLYIHHIDEFGINFQDINYLEITDCTLDYCGFGCIGGPAAVKGGWQNVEISACTLSYSGHYYQSVESPGVSPYSRPDGFGIEPSEGPIEIWDCLVEHNRGDGLDSKAARTSIHHCIVANNSCDGIKLWGDSSRIENCLIYGTGDGDATPTPWANIVIDNATVPNAYFEIINTTAHDNPARHNYPMYVQYDSSNPIQLVMKNSIVSNGYGVVYIGDDVTFTAENNIFYRPGESVQVYANSRDYTNVQIENGDLGTGNLSQDPQFVSPAWGSTGNYQLQLTSPAIDAGCGGSGMPVTDLDYTARPQSGYYDIGAYEVVPCFVKIQVFLEGPYDAIRDSMQTDLNAQLPLQSPYTEAPDSTDQMISTVTDWILMQVYASDGVTVEGNFSRLLSGSGWMMDKTGQTVAALPRIGDGSYFVQVNHRNHLSVTSRSLVSLASGDTALVNFTTDSSVYKNTDAAVELESGIWGVRSGDCTQDSVIDSDDYQTWLQSAQSGNSGYQDADFNLDGEVTTEDYVIWFNNRQ